MGVLLFFNLEILFFTLRKHLELSFRTREFRDPIEELLSLGAESRPWHCCKAITFYPNHFAVKNVIFLCEKKNKIK